jgi:cyclopropane-fatty-acyl-phospholipid synthase
MSVVSIVGTAERVPLPDAVVRAAIHQLCSRTATWLASSGAADDAAFARATADRAISECTEVANAQHYELPAAFFAKGARAEPQIFLRLLPEAGQHLAGR